MWIGIIVLLAAALIICYLRSEYEKKHFSVETFVIKSKKIKKNRTFVFLSDLHNNEFGEKNQTLLAVIEKINPDGILIGGDMMVCKGEPGIAVAADLVLKLAARYPVWYGNGNHENRMDMQRDIYGDQYDEYRQFLIDNGVNYLSDSSVFVDTDLAITGFNLKAGFYRNISPDSMNEEDIINSAGPASADRFQILLAHSPLFFDCYRSWGADLTLSGHMHGGTIRIPGLGGLMTPQFQFFLPWCAGYFCINDKYMIVSRGLGTHSINIRFNNKPQLAVVKLNKK